MLAYLVHNGLFLKYSDSKRKSWYYGKRFRLSATHHLVFQGWINGQNVFQWQGARGAEAQLTSFDFLPAGGSGPGRRIRHLPAARGESDAVAHVHRPVPADAGRSTRRLDTGCPGPRQPLSDSRPHPAAPPTLTEPSSQGYRGRSWRAIERDTALWKHMWVCLLLALLFVTVVSNFLNLYLLTRLHSVTACVINKATFGNKSVFWYKDPWYLKY